MPRANYQEAKSYVTNLLQSKGGEMTRIELDKALNDGGVGEYVGWLKQMRDQGAVKARVVARPGEKPVLIYSLP